MSIIDTKKLKSGFLTALGICLLLLSVALAEGAGISFIPKWLLYVIAFTSPFFLYRVWIIYLNREELKSVYFMSETMMRDIKIKKGWGKYKKKEGEEK